MRYIKLRGKSINGDWYYGLLPESKGYKSQPEKGLYISNKCGMPWAYQVRPETVGQYTGLKDKNGVEIYEGDIVEVTEDVKTYGEVQDDGNTLWNVIDSGLRFEVAWHTMQPELCLCPIGESEKADMDTVELWLWNNDGGSECLEVIGNIYENPELLPLTTKEEERSEVIN